MTLELLHLEGAAFQLDREVRDVANFAGTPVLDRTRVGVGFSLGPSIAVLGEELERSAVQFHESLLDHRLVGTVTTFDVHHHGDRNATGSPLFDTLGQVTHRAHVAVHLVEGEHRSGVTEAVAVVGVEVRRSGATAFVTEEVVEGGELALEVLAALEFLLHHFDDELFGFDEGNLHVAVAVAVQHQLALSGGGEALEDFGRSLGNPFHGGRGLRRVQK